MAAKKKYAASVDYEKKLDSVMNRLNVTKYDYDYGRKICFVEFLYKGKAYRWEHSIERAQELGINIHYGSDAFAIVVLSLEKIAWMIENGVFDLENGTVPGLKQLPPPNKIPDCFKLMGFVEIPTTEQLKDRYHALAKSLHPDTGGTQEAFMQMQSAYEDCNRYFEKAV